MATGKLEWQRTERQTRTWQRRIIESAQKRDDTAGLCWYVEYVLPPHLRKRPGDYLRPALLHGWVPVVPLRAGVEYAQEVSGILSVWLESRYGRLGSEFLPVLAQFETLDEHRIPWFVWGEAHPWLEDEIDICAHCGGLAPCPCQERRLYAVDDGSAVHLMRAGRLICGETSPQWRWACDLGAKRRAWDLSVCTCPACRLGVEGEASDG